LTLGDVLVFDVAGRRVSAPVTSVRTHDRGLRSFSSLVRSSFVFTPGLLETLPHSFVGAAKGPADAQARARLQNDFVAAFPSVTFLDALDEIQEVRARVASVSLAVSAIGTFVLSCGILVLLGSVAMTRVHRLYEAAIFRTLGAKARLLVRMTIVEYGLLGLLAGGIGSLGSIAVTWAASRFGARAIPWHLHLWINVAGAAATAALVIVAGVLATAGVIRRKPTTVLREMQES
jgi:putative ABC transport system permease protein